MESHADIVFVLPAKMGGVFSLNRNLLLHGKQRGVTQHAVLTAAKDEVDTRNLVALGADHELIFEYDLALDNLHRVLRRLHRAIPPGPGALVANERLELAMLHVHSTDRTVFFFVHDQHYLNLALTHASVIDAFLCHTVWFRDRMREALPHRRADILHLPYGVPIASAARTPVDGPLRLIFIGRLSHSKGVMDLPAIDASLSEAGVEVHWTIVGSGPLGIELKSSWSRSDVQYLEPTTNEEVLALCAHHDVLVFPTRFEGFPVALLETMGAGVVPVVSDLPSGVPEVVSEETGFRIEIGDTSAFSRAIQVLDEDRSRLESMSTACRRTVATRFELSVRMEEYVRTLSQHQFYRRTKGPCARLPYGSRLDSPWIPNSLVRGIRRLRRWVRPAHAP